MNTDLADFRGFIKNIDRFNPDVLDTISANPFNQRKSASNFPFDFNSRLRFI
jgi:hypothetical protein